MNEITTKELKQMIDRKEKFILLDCRGIDYFLQEHIPGAINIRWKYVSEKAKKILPDKDTLIVTYCDGFTCNASVRCYENLVKLGYKNILEYSGGLGDWKAHGFKTVSNTNFKITDNVYRFPNQTFYDENVNSYLIIESDFVLLIDGPQQLTEEHEDFIVHFHKPIKIFMTHDPTAGETEKLQKNYGAKIYLHQADKQGALLTVKPDVFIDDEYTFNDHLRVIHSPSHTPGSSVLLDTKQKILFTGDTVQGTSGGGVYNFLSSDNDQAGDRKKRFQSVKKLLAYDFDRLLPFHYSILYRNAKKVLTEFVHNHD